MAPAEALGQLPVKLSEFVAPRRYSSGWPGRRLDIAGIFSEYAVQLAA
jgi:hypothetical protein